MPPGTFYGERLNQLDLRVGKVVKVGRTRTTFNLDLYNALNANPVMALNGTFNAAPTATPTAAWLAPQSIIDRAFREIQRPPRFLSRPLRAHTVRQKTGHCVVI